MIDRPDMRDRLMALPPTQRAQLIQQLRAARAGRPVAGAIPVVGRDEPLPLSYAQQRLYFLDQLAPGLPLYNIPYALRLRGAVELDLLADALRRVVGRHEVLRTRYVHTEAGPRQVVDPPPDRLDLPVHDLPGIPPQERDQRARELAAELAAQPFDLAAGPLFRATVARLDPDDHVLVLAVHHIATDAWSTGLLVRELGEFYATSRAGGTPGLAPLAVQYADYAAWQQRQLAGDGATRHLTYWRDRLAGLPVLDLPTDRPRPAEPTWAGAVLGRRLPAELHRSIAALADRAGVRLLPVLLAGFTALLSRYTGQLDVPVGSIFSGRTRSEVEPLLGFFANTVVLRMSTAGDPTFGELLDRVNEAVLGAHDHQDLPFDHLVNELRPARDPSRNPLFQVALYLADGGAGQLALGDVRVDQLPVSLGTSRFDLTISAAEAPDQGGIDLELEYATELFDDDRMSRLLDHLTEVLRQVTADPDTRLSGLELLTGAERDLILGEWTATDLAPGPARLIHDAVAEQVRRTPDAVAVVHGDTRLSYAELAERADRLAARLRAVGARPGTLVGICAGRSAELVVALLAVLRSGAAYVPLDPEYPLARLRLMLDDAEPVAVLVDEAGRECLGPLPAGPRLVDLADAAADDGPERDADDRPERDADGGAEPVAAVDDVLAGDAAYVIYTSGSTGRPKGVVVEHAQVLNFFLAMDQQIEVGGEDGPGTWLAVTSVSFDISVLELLWTLTRGLRVVVAGGRAADVLPARPAPRTPTDTAFSLFYFASDAELPGDRYQLLLDGARFADRHGFSAVWVPERHFHAFGGNYPSPAVVASALSMVTERVAIRAGSVVLPLHHPVRVAEEWSVIDNLSHGRVGLSVASGWHADDFVFAPDNYADRRTVMVEQLEAVRELWRGGSVRLPGGAGAPVDVRIRPRPVQPELPVWITAAGSPETFRKAGAIGANLLTHLLGQDVDQLAEKIAGYRAAHREATGTDGHVTLMLHAFVGDDHDRVLRTVRGPFIEYLRGSLDLVRTLAQRMGMDVAAGTVSADDIDVVLDHAFDRYVHESGLFGTPEDCLPLVDRLVGVGVDEIACLVDFGVDRDEVLAALPHLDRLRRLVTGAQPTQTGRDQGPDDPADESVPALIARHGVTHLQCTPALARLLVEHPHGRAGLARLRTLLVGGEALPGALLAALTDATDARIVNMYGPTETTIWSTTQPAGQPGDTAAAAVPIGRPIANTVVRVLDRWQRPVPVGITGELSIGGAGVTRGYHRRPALTAERYGPDAAGTGRLYRTGDLVRWRSDGRLEFHGRADHQVKVRGFRIELGEIEAALRAVPGVGNAAVVTRASAGGEARLVAYLVAAAGEPRPDTEDLRAALRAHLPEHMVPAAYEWLDALPLTPNNKVDTAALPEPGQAAPATPMLAPRNDVERTLAEVWCEVLELDQVSVLANFFELGGNSIVAIRVVDLVNRRGLGISVRLLFTHQSIAELARAVGGTAEENTGGPVPLHPGTGRPPVWFVHASGGSSLAYLHLAGHLGADRPGYGIDAVGLTGTPPLTSVPEMAERYAALIRATTPQGPYHLVGWSTGGGLALAVAQRLRADGAEVGLLALLDAAPPPMLAEPPETAEVLALFAADFALSIGAQPPALEAAELRGRPEPEQFDVLLARLADAGLTAGMRPADVAARARVFLATVAAGAVWRPEPFAGPVDLLLATDGGDPQRFRTGWGALVTGGLREHRVAGDHYAMMGQPAAPALAATLRDLLAEREAGR
ncbi:MupA/Atu3671 family FMN-dependent luciferase-like monooxygenase [Micromonospora sp. WMMA1923]|uniref:MupA/Atu3671 family FMN-dependent luciferase-like monooxygenase n=1 Tax=Micromonospora sp. WMMA1923 TaxID=3404125 RepID=UPI003B959832